MTTTTLTMTRSPEWAALEARAAGIKSAIQNCMDTMANQQNEWNLQETPEPFRAARQLLDRNDFNLLVCGEVKHGKSTLLNAIIGQDVLPTGVKETTCQIFRVSHSEEESFALVFTDGHREPITKEELQRYGSQTEIDRRGEPLFAGRMLQWIEVNVPVAFLPKGVHLIDTPGLGATYAAHTAVTMRFVQEADAVVFVSECAREYTVPQLDFIERLLEQTENILFVLSKIDCREVSAWKEIQMRNESLLNERFPRNRPWSILPISSKQLLDASDTKSQEQDRRDSLEDSGFEEFRERLDKSNYRMVGWTTSAVAIMAANQYHDEITKSLDTQNKMLAAPSEERHRIAEEQRSVQIRFTEAWGPNGTERKRATDTYREIMAGLANRGSRICNPNSKIFIRFQDTLTRLKNIDDLMAFNEALRTDVYNAVYDEWSQMSNDAQRQFSEKLRELNISVNDQNISPISVHLLPVKKTQLQKKAMTTAQRGFMGASVGGTAGFLLGTALTFITGGLAAPAVPALIYAGGFLGVTQGSIDGFTDVTKMDFHQAQATVKENLQKVLNVISAKLSETEDGMSMLQKMTSDLERQFTDALNKTVQSREAQMKADLTTLQEQSVCGEKQRAEQLARIRTQIGDWKAHRIEIERISDTLKECEAM